MGQDVVVNEVNSGAKEDERSGVKIRLRLNVSSAVSNVSGTLENIISEQTASGSLPTLTPSPVGAGSPPSQRGDDGERAGVVEEKPDAVSTRSDGGDEDEDWDVEDDDDDDDEDWDDEDDDDDEDDEDDIDDGLSPSPLTINGHTGPALNSEVHQVSSPTEVTASKAGSIAEAKDNAIALQSAAQSALTMEEEVASIAAQDAADGHLNTQHRQIMYDILSGSTLRDIAIKLGMEKEVLAQIVGSPLFQMQFRALKERVTGGILDMNAAARSFQPEALMKIVTLMRRGGNHQRLQFDAAMALINIGNAAGGTKNGLRAGGSNSVSGHDLVPTADNSDYGRRVRRIWERHDTVAAASGEQKTTTTRIAEERVEG